MGMASWTSLCPITTNHIVSVYRNTCTPGNISTNSFATRVDFATGAQPQGIAVRDLDGDGKPDLLVAIVVMEPFPFCATRE